MKASEFLNSLVQSLPILEILSKMTSNTVDDWAIKLANKLKDDDDLMVQLEAWLRWTPMISSTAAAEHNDSEPELPSGCDCCEAQLLEVRSHLT